MPKGKVLIAGNDESARSLFERALAERGFEVLSSASGEQTLLTAASQSLSVVILDADMPEMDGLETCRELRKDVFVPVIMLGAHCAETDVVLALGMGADYFLPKPVKVSELIAHVEAAIRRETVYARRRCEQDKVLIKDLEVDYAAHEVRRDGKTITLSPTEFRLLRTLARNAGRILTRDQLLDSVWDLKADGIYSRTVDVHIGRIRKKIGDDPSRPRYIVTVPGLGYKMVNS